MKHKFIVFTDIHIRSDNPISRVGNIQEDLLNKLDWIINYRE